MLHLRKLTMREIRLPLKEPFRISSGVEHDRRIILLELEDADGATAWSECVGMDTPNYKPETTDIAWFTLQHWFIPRVLGRTFHALGELLPVLDEHIRGHEMAKAALEMGFWGLAAEKTGVALATLLGGTRPEVAVGISLGIQPSIEHVLRKVEAAQVQGYRRIKMKIKPGADLAYLRAARDVLGPEALLMADANSAYTLEDVETLRAMDDLNLLMIEQPLAWDDQIRHARLQAQIQTPVCLDESIASLRHAEDMVATGSGRIINIKPGRVGGLASAKAIHDFCLSEDVPVWCGGMLESGIGRAYNVALASLPGFTLPGDISPSARYWARDITSPEWTMNPDGFTRVPFDRPGIGVEVDLDRIDDLTQRAEIFLA